MRKIVASIFIAAITLAPASLANAVTVSGQVTSVITYDDILDGPTTIEIIHPTTITCYNSSDDNWGEACQFDAQVRATSETFVDVYVFDVYDYSIGSVRVADEEWWTPEWQTATIYISAPEYEGEAVETYQIGLEWEDVTSSSVTPITVNWQVLANLASVGSKKVTVKNTKPFKNGSTITVSSSVKAPKNGCGNLLVSYRISSRAIPGLYSHAILVEDSRGRVAGSVILRTEDNGYRGTAKIVLCSYSWWYDEEETVERISVKPGNYKIYLAEFDDYYISYGFSKKSNISFRN